MWHNPYLARDYGIGNTWDNGWRPHQDFNPTIDGGNYFDDWQSQGIIDIEEPYFTEDVYSRDFISVDNYTFAVLYFCTGNREAVIFDNRRKLNKDSKGSTI